MLSYIIFLYIFVKVIKTLPMKREKRSLPPSSGLFNAKPIFNDYFDDEDSYLDDEEEDLGDASYAEAVYHEPKKKSQSQRWKINFNKTKDDVFIIEGDIRLTVNQKLHTAPIFDTPNKRSRRAARSKEPEYLWRYNTIYYKIDSNFGRETKREIKLGIREWKRTMKNCLKFVRLDRDPKLERRVSQERFGGGPVHHILLTKTDTGCWSNVGRVDTNFQNQPLVLGRQVISIGDGCGERGTVIHEIGHAIGFWHEQSRRDRDKYVKIVKNNILYGQKEQFKRMAEKQVGSMGYAYDFWSVMHYGPTFFSKNGKPTIRILKDFRYLKPNMGQRIGLSYLDIAQVRAMYKCNILPSKESSSKCINKKTKGRDYRGTLDYTENGVMCQPWNKQYPHKHDYKLYNQKDGLGKHNFCRNPGGDRERPWCFTTLGPGFNKWEYCDIKKECKS